VKYEDYPFEEIAQAMERRLREGYDFYQKFTCGSCGARLTMELKNTLFASGTCDRCGHTTDITKSGCNYLLSKAIPHD
jgi:predicted RNA-binding Zn-ribbon protein involved in translation (DUF1610 family)